MLDRGHIDQEPARHCDMRGDPRSLSCDRLLGDLNQDLLTFAQKLGYRRLRTAFASIASPAAARVLTVPWATVSTAISAPISAPSRPTVPPAAVIFNFFLFLRL